MKVVLWPVLVAGISLVGCVGPGPYIAKEYCKGHEIKSDESVLITNLNSTDDIAAAYVVAEEHCQETGKYAARLCGSVPSGRQMWFRCYSSNDIDTFKTVYESYAAYSGDVVPSCHSYE